MKTIASHRQTGFTIIELMIAVAIGLVITIAVTNAYLSGLGTQQAQTNLSRAQESSRFASDLLVYSFRKAGYKNPAAPGNAFCEGTKPVGAGVCDSPTTTLRLVLLNDPATIDPTAANLVGTTVSISNNSDVIRVRYYGEGLTVTPFTSDGTITDCLGNSVLTNALVEDTFFVAPDANNDNEPTLFCYTTNATASGNVALVPGIESMQLLYGEDNASDDCYGIVDRYVRGSTVANVNNVRSVMLSIVTRTKEAGAIDRSAITFNHFGRSYAPSDTAPTGDSGSVFTSPTDGRIRQHFSTTISLRNLCPV